MLIDFWHYWLLLRPLLVFVLAAPFFIIALVFRGRRQSRSLKGKTADAPVLPSTHPEGYPTQGPEHRVVEAGPQEWRVDSVGSDRRAA